MDYLVDGAPPAQIVGQLRLTRAQRLFKIIPSQ
jgi:hypothetical protein